MPPWILPYVNLIRAVVRQAQKDLTNPQWAEDAQAFFRPGGGQAMWHRIILAAVSDEE